MEDRLIRICNPKNQRVKKLENLLIDNPMWTVGLGLDLFLAPENGPRGLVHLLGNSGPSYGPGWFSLMLDCIR